MSIEAQAALAEEFVRGVVARFGLEATVSSTIDEEHIRVSVDGDGVGYLIGPRGSTIDALQELTRTVVQRRGEDSGGRINVDVGGYRARRAAALAQFAQKVAREVIESGAAQALEPMNAADRKVVHDAVNEMDGVATSSEGDDPSRYVVIRPSGSAAAAAAAADEDDDAGSGEDDDAGSGEDDDAGSGEDDDAGAASPGVSATDEDAPTGDAADADEDDDGDDDGEEAGASDDDGSGENDDAEEAGASDDDGSGENDDAEG